MTSLIRTEITLVTPDVATEWLERNTDNRVLREAKVREFAADMREGRWQFNGDPVRFGRDGRLLDGQHRLWAILESGEAQEFLVIHGVPDAAQVTMDQGTRRTPTDQLHIVGVDIDNSAAAAIRIYIRWVTGRLFGDALRAKVTTPEVVEWAQGNEHRLDLLRRLGGFRGIPTTPSITRAVALRLHEIDYDFAQDFFSRLATGANLSGDSPVLALRRRIERTKNDKLKVSDRDQIGLFVVAWNAEREGRTLTKLQRPNGAGWTAETFPEPR